MADFNLPDEVLAVIPTDPYDQLDLARKITSMAIASRVSNLESEVGRFKQKVYEKDGIIAELEEKVDRLEAAFREAETRLRFAHEDNMKLSKERDSYAIAAKKMSRDLQKLETFKKQLMQSLNDDNTSQAETVDIVTYDQSVNRSYSTKDEVNSNTGCYSFSSAETGYTSEDASKQGAQKFSITPYITPRISPSGTPKIASKTVSPIRHSGATSPIKTQYEERSSVSSWYSSSQHSSAANSPPRGRPIPARPPRIDGKEFFRQSRSRLSYEQFSAFLANIKEFNSQKQTREETLRKAEDIFGMDNRDLYLSFQGLLNRNIH